MTNNQNRIFLSWVFLLLFILGQTVLYAHQHKAMGLQKRPYRPAIASKCQLCDAMHNSHIVLTDEVFFEPISRSYVFFTDQTYKFLSLSLILSSGRAPPSL